MQSLKTPSCQCSYGPRSYSRAWVPLRILQPIRSHANYYEVLQLETDATAADVKEAYRTLAKQLHPDVNKRPNAQEAFMLVKRAYHVLSQAELRAEHDSSLGLASARAKDPRFARFERWRREVVPDLREQLAVWTQEINLIFSEAEDKLQQLHSSAQAAASSQVSRAQTLQSTASSTSSTSSTRSSEDLAAAKAELLGAIGDMKAKVQRQYDKRYEQVQVRYPAYPDLVWYDIWEEVADAWLLDLTQKTQHWEQLLKALGE